MRDSERTRKFTNALEIATHNALVISRFESGEDRPASPDAWTEKEEVDATGVPTVRAAQDLLRAQSEVAEGENILLDQAMSDALKMFKSKPNATPDQVMAQRDVRMGVLKRTNVDYLQAVRALRRLEARGGGVV
jgi:MoxR-like ATPase